MGCGASYCITGSGSWLLSEFWKDICWGSAWEAASSTLDDLVSSSIAISTVYLLSIMGCLLSSTTAATAGSGSFELAFCSADVLLYEWLSETSYAATSSFWLLGWLLAPLLIGLGAASSASVLIASCAAISV